MSALARFRFPGSSSYWDERYRAGGTSGSGSTGRLAAFKSDVINRFVESRRIQSVIELGCGDGQQLAAAKYPSYIGLDVSRAAVMRCMQTFAADTSKSFFLYDSSAFCDNDAVFRAELALSLDVIYHLVEDRVFERYMRHLFASAERYVIIYASDFDAAQTYHERDRAFSRWIAANVTGWTLEQRIANLYPYDPRAPEDTSKSDFFVYARGS